MLLLKVCYVLCEFLLYSNLLEFLWMNKYNNTLHLHKHSFSFIFIAFLCILTLFYTIFSTFCCISRLFTSFMHQFLFLFLYGIVLCLFLSWISVVLRAKHWNVYLFCISVEQFSNVTEDFCSFCVSQQNNNRIYSKIKVFKCQSAASFTHFFTKKGEQFFLQKPLKFEKIL